MWVKDEKVFDNYLFSQKKKDLYDMIILEEGIRAGSVVCTGVPYLQHMDFIYAWPSRPGWVGLRHVFQLCPLKQIGAAFSADCNSVTPELSCEGVAVGWLFPSATARLQPVNLVHY